MSLNRVWLNQSAPVEGTTVFHSQADTSGLRTIDSVDRAWPVVPANGTVPDVSRTILTGGTAEGVECVVINNGRYSMAVLPTRGMGVHSIRLNDQSSAGPGFIGWNSPVPRPVHPAFVNLESRNGLGWLDGFNELVCRCGLSSNGPPGTDAEARSPIESALTLHGKIANLPAHSVSAAIDHDTQSLSVSGVVDEATLFGPQLRMTSTLSSQFGGNSFTIEDLIENRASTPGELQLLYHINVGSPVLQGGSRILIAADEIAPRDPRAAEGIDSWSECLPPTAGYAEQAYFFRPRANNRGEATALLTNAAGDGGFAVTFDVKALPFFVAWKCTQPEADGYVTGLEPALNFPNLKTFERQQGRVVSLAPGEQYRTRVTLTVLSSAAEVNQVVEAIKSLQGSTPPVIHAQPRAGWSPGA